MHEVEHVDAEGFEVVVDLRTQFVGLSSGRPASLSMGPGVGEVGGTRSLGAREWAGL